MHIRAVLDERDIVITHRRNDTGAAEVRASDDFDAIAVFKVLPQVPYPYRYVLRGHFDRSTSGVEGLQLDNCRVRNDVRNSSPQTCLLSTRDSDEIARFQSNLVWVGGDIYSSPCKDNHFVIDGVRDVHFEGASAEV